MKTLALVIAAGVAGAAAVSAQTIYLNENHDSSVPGPGWTHEKIHPAAQGWIQSADLRAWHEDEPAAIGPADDRLVSPSMDLRGAGAVYVHFHSQLAFARWLANHPASLGDGENDLWVSTDDGATWTEVWTDARIVDSTDWTTVDLSAYAGHANVRIALRYFGTYAQEWWVDEVRVDDAPGHSLPPPVTWSVDLPALRLPVAAFAGCDGFESYAGIVPQSMALTAVDAVSGAADPEAWCTIAGGTVAAAAGVRNLEMGLRPGSTNYHQVRNALVIGLEGAGAGLLTLDFMGINFGEEVHPADGVWVSSNGADWYRALVSWTGIPANGAWHPVTVDLADFAAITGAPFYLMFQQQDDFPYHDLDGIGVDEVCLTSSIPLGLTLARLGACPGAIVLEVAGATPGAPVALFYGQAGAFTQTNPNKACFGIVLGIRSPHFTGMLTANAAGQASVQFNAPAGACGLTVQAVDVGACAASNAVVL